jgi:hypothetical protein
MRESDSVGMSSRLRKAFVAAKPKVFLNLPARARQSVATAACSSQTGGRLFRATAMERMKPPDEQELIPTGLAVRKQEVANAGRRA